MYHTATVVTGHAALPFHLNSTDCVAISPGGGGISADRQVTGDSTQGQVQCEAAIYNSADVPLRDQILLASPISDSSTGEINFAAVWRAPTDNAAGKLNNTTKTTTTTTPSKYTAAWNRTHA